MNIYIYVNIYKTFVDEHIHYSFMIIDYLNFLYHNEAFTVCFCKILKALVYIFLHYDWLMFIIVFPYSCTCVTHKAPSYDHLMVQKSLCVACSLSFDMYSPTVSSSWLWLFLCVVFLSASLATRKFGFDLPYSSLYLAHTTSGFFLSSSLRPQLLNFKMPVSPVLRRISSTWSWGDIILFLLKIISHCCLKRDFASALFGFDQFIFTWLSNSLLNSRHFLEFLFDSLLIAW